MLRTGYKCLDVISMKNRTLALLILVAIASVGCNSEPEEMIQFYDSHITAEFEKRLIENRVQYRKTDNQFYFSYSYRDKIAKIKSEVIGQLEPEQSFLFNKQELFVDVREAFDLAGIKYRVVERDNGNGLSWGKDDSVKARGIIRSVTGIPL